MSARTPLAVALTLAALLPAAAGAVTVSGQVRDEQGFGIFDVDLDFFDRDLGQVIFTPGDNTDFSGFYSVDVPPGEYDILFNAPAGSPYLDVELRQVDIVGPETIDVTMPVGRPITGRVTDPGGVPLVNIDLNVVDLVTGDVLDTNDDNTDVLGNFLVRVPAGTYDILFTAPLGQPWAGGRLESVAVAGSTHVGDVVLQPGLFLSGTLRGPGGVPLAGADLDVEDPLTGDAIYTPRDNTDALGAFSVAVPAGTWDVILGSPPGSGLAWKALRDVAVSADLPLGIITLDPGFAVTGIVQDGSAVALPGADLDLLDAAGDDVPMPDDNAGAGGAFSLLAATGTYDVAVSPPVGAPLASTVLRGVTVAGATSLGAITLPAGFSISGFVRDGALPVVGADLDAFELATGLPWPTAHDDSSSDGSYSIRLPAGSWRIIAFPPPGSGLQPDTLDVDPLASDLVADFDLSGSSVDVAAGPAASEGLRLVANPNPFRASTSLRFEMPSGATAARITIHDLAGRAVRRWAPSTSTSRGEVTWDGRDGAGRRVASGIYWVRLETDRSTLARKVTVLR